VDVKQAAEALGISSEGIRQRIRRGSLESEKDTDGRVYVFIDEEATNGASYERSTDDVVTRLENEVEFLRKELATRRRDPAPGRCTFIFVRGP
jgi:predicted site-specific integrase-resolvase